MKESIKKYSVAIIFSGIIYTIVFFYLYTRRGYFDLWIANKILATDAIILLGIVFLIGIFSRLFQFFDPMLQYRKELGIAAFFLALLHGVISLFFLPYRFPISYYQKNIFIFLLGFFGLIILTILFVLSLRYTIRLIHPKIWWSLQNWGIRITMLFVFLHVFIMKYPGWVRWLQIGGGDELVRPFMPPASLIAAFFIFLIFIIRLAEFGGISYARFFTFFCSVLFCVIVIGLFVYGKIKTPQALPISWKTCITLPGSRILESYPSQCISRDRRRAVEPILTQ